MTEADHMVAVTGAGANGRDAQGVTAPLPTRRYLARDEASAWLGLSIDSFNRLDIPYVDLGPRCKRWDVVDIVAYAEQNKSCDSARTSEPTNQRRRQTCVSINATAPPNGGPHGTTTTVNASVKALGLKIKS